MTIREDSPSQANGGPALDPASVTTHAIVDPCTDPGWAALMAGPSGNLFGSPPWISAIAGTYGFDIAADLLIDDGGPVAGLAHAEVSDLRGSRIISLPFCDYLDPAVATADQWSRLIDPVLARHLPVQLRVLHAEAPRFDSRFETVSDLMWHSTDLRRPADEVVAGFASKARQGARSARRQDVTVTFSNELDDVRAFHDLHRRTRKHKYGLLAQPFSFFEHIWKQFAPLDGLAVGLAHHDGEVIAGGFYLFWNDVMYYKFGASIAERLSLRPNDLLAWESICYGCARGAVKYDWGVSDLDQPGLFSFKRKYATEEGKVTVLRHRPVGHDPQEGAEAGALLGDLTHLLTQEDVPDSVTQRAGELLYRFFC